MNIGQTIFSQLMDLLPTWEFNRCVSRYRGNHRVRQFSCRDQFLCMAFAQLTYRESLRDIETCLRSMGHKFCPAGFLAIVARDTLASWSDGRPSSEACGLETEEKPSGQVHLLLQCFAQLNGASPA